MTSWYGSMLYAYCCLQLLLGAQQVWASKLNSAVSENDNIQEYHLERMPLESALAQFVEQTGLSLLYESSLVQQRFSHAVHGRMPAIVALQRLLTGTPIHVHSLRNRSYLLSTEAVIASPLPVQPPSHSPQHNLQVQQALLQQLCKHAAALLHEHRIALRIVIDRQGRIAAVKVSIATRVDQEPYVQSLLQGLYVGIVPYGIDPSTVWLIDQSQSPRAPVCP